MRVALPQTMPTCRVVEVAVRQNQHVKASDLLFRLDPRPYELAVIASALVTPIVGWISDPARLTNGFHRCLRRFQ